MGKPVRHDPPSVEPNDAEHVFRRAKQAAHREEFHDANRFYHWAADLRPEKELWRWKSLGFCPTTFPDEESIDRYWERLDQSLDLALEKNLPMDWRTLPGDGFCPSFNLPHLGKCCKDIRQKFARIFEKAFPQQRSKPTKRSSGKLRIGFHALYGHEGGFIRCTAGLIDGLDRKRFELFVFAPDLGIGQCKQSIRSDDVTFVPLGGPFETVVRKVRETECDLMYYRKAGSDPWSYFFPFTRCAPVQATSCGTHGTSGIPAMDYFLSSAFIEPGDAQRYYTERLVRLDSVHLFIKRLEQPETPPSRAEFGLPEDGAVYFCPHRTAKYHPSFDPILKRIAERDPAGRFVLLTGRDARGRDLLTERLKHNLGDTVYRRLTLIHALPYEKYKRLLALATVMLDSPVYAGGLTSFDAFSYGIPEVTLSGPLLVQNFATGLYGKMGLDRLPCSDVDAYVDRAVHLGTDHSYRNEISRAIVENGDRLFGSREVIDAHERFFEAACTGESA